MGVCYLCLLLANIDLKIIATAVADIADDDDVADDADDDDGAKRCFIKTYLHQRFSE